MPGVKQENLTYNINATGAIAKKRFMNRAGGQATAAQNTLGVVDFSVASGETALVDSLGWTFVECGAALDGSEQRLQTDANGRAVAYTSGPTVAILPPGVTSSASGQEVSVILISN